MDPDPMASNLDPQFSKEGIEFGKSMVAPK